jgi:hypothetical protein
MVGGDKFADKDDGFIIMVNTAITLGSELICFLAYISAGCEIHIYIHQDDKEYFANVLTEGITQGIIPKAYGKESYPSGWEDVINMFRNDPGHIVVSYSVCSIFPEGWGENCVDWDNIGREDKWEYAIKEITKDKERHICRGGRDKVGNGTTIMDINNMLARLRGDVL